MYVENISSLPLSPTNNITILNNGNELLAFENGIFLWSNNLTESSDYLSLWSVGILKPQYFPVLLGDGRFALFDFSIGICWASEYNINKYVILF